MKKLLPVTILLLAVLCLGGCGSGGDSGSLPVKDPTPPPVIIDPGSPSPGDPITVNGILLSTSSSAIAPNGTTTLSVTLFDASGQLVTTPKFLYFTSDAPTLGSIVSPVQVSNGFATAIFTARATPGTVKITATVDDATQETTIQISTQVSAASINVLSNPTSTSVGGTTTVSATVLDSNNNPMPNGTTVNFAVDNTAVGTIVASATTTSGVAQATFSAGITTPGPVTVTASSGSTTGSTTINVTGTSAGSIEFFAAEPQIISIQGSGGQETSDIQFLIKDSNGNPIIQSQTVHLILSGPNGGEYLGTTVGTSTLDVGTSIDGIARVILHSGTIPGTATITASVVGTTLSTSSGVIAIGGGIPSAGHFSLSAATLNLEGGAYDNVQDEILTLIADRYGNKNVLKGTAVSYYSECGAIDRAIALDELGQGTVIFRTQDPGPQDLLPDPLPTPLGSGSCGVRCDQENAVISAFSTYFDIDITADPEGDNPRDGLCSIIAVVDGEEEFTDGNANGVYNLGEYFVDTYDDIHIEMDDDPNNIVSIAAGKPHDAIFEDLVVDRNKDGVFTGLNGIWDYNKRISKKLDILYTGAPYLTLSNIAIIPNGGSQTIYFALHDENYNRPIAGTTLKAEVTGTAVIMTGQTEYEYFDSNALGTPILAVTISDSDPATNQTEVIDIKFTWEWKGATWILSISGIAN
jgi:hypothetical protein